jgi:hypothetical protein
MGLSAGTPDAGLPEEERPAVGRAALRLLARGTHAVSAVVLQAHEHGLAARRRRGEPRPGLERHPDIDA